MRQPSTAVIYPILPEHIKRLYEGKNVFCKYVGERPLNIPIGGKLIFYQSWGKGGRNSSWGNP
jgi:hypothetical protein